MRSSRSSPSISPVAINETALSSSIHTVMLLFENPAPPGYIAMLDPDQSSLALETPMSVTPSPVRSPITAPSGTAPQGTVNEGVDDQRGDDPCMKPRTLQADSDDTRRSDFPSEFMSPATTRDGGVEMLTSNDGVEGN